MNCKTALNLCEQARDESLSGSTASALQAHVETCPHCREFMQQRNQMTGALSLLTEEPQAPAHLHSRVMLALRSRDRWQPMAHRSRRQRAARLVLVGGAALVSLLVALLCYRAGVKSSKSEGVVAVKPSPPPTEPAPAAVATPPETPPSVGSGVTRANHFKRHNPSPRKTRPRPVGRVLRRAIPPLPLPMARLVAVSGDLSKRDDQSDWQPARRGAVVRAGEMLRTGASSSGRLTLRDASMVELRPRGVLQVRRDCLALFEGKLFASIRPQHKAFVIRTPTARVQVLGTRFSVAVQHTTDVHVAVVEGTVRLTNRLGSAKVRAGEEATAGADSPPALLSRPSPPPTATVIQIRAELANPDGVFQAATDTPTFNLVVNYHNAPYQPLTLRATVTNERGEVVTEIQEPIATEQYRHTRRPVKIPVAEPGKYRVRFSLEAKDGAAETKAAFSIVGQTRDTEAPGVRNPAGGAAQPRP